MMFRTRDDDLIARLQGKTLGGFSPTPQRCIAECGGEQVQSGRGTTGDDDLLFTFGRIRADQLGHLGSGLLKGHGATGGQLVRTTVHAGVNCTVEFASASITAFGFCEVAAESRYTSGCP